MSSTSLNLTLKMNFLFKKQEKNWMELVLMSKVATALAQFCVSLKIADQKVSRIGADLSRYS